MSLRRVALIGFGEVGQTLAQDFSGRGLTLSVSDLLFNDARSVPSLALADHTLLAFPTTTEAVRDADLVISAVTAANDHAAAEAAAPGLKPGALFLDLNSASPKSKQASAAAIDEAGGRYVEAAVMSPIGLKRIKSPMLLGGPHAAEALPHLQVLGFTGAEVFSNQVGPAAATKLCRSVIIKGVEALLTESMLAARYYGVEQIVLDSLSDLLPLPDWNKTAQYMISRSLEHAARRAEEMREAARTVAEAGIAPLMSDAIAKRQDWAADYRGALSPDLIAMLDAVPRDAK